MQVFNPDGSYYATISQAGPDNTGSTVPVAWVFLPQRRHLRRRYLRPRGHIFNRYRRYLATLGDGRPGGTDNAHFDEPEDAAVDSRGFIYVADKKNDRVQVFDANRAYVRTIGVTGQWGRDFDHLSGPSPCSWIPLTVSTSTMTTTTASRSSTPTAPI